MIPNILFKRISRWETDLVTKGVGTSWEDEILHIAVLDRGIPRERLIELWTSSLMAVGVSHVFLVSAFFTSPLFVAYFLLTLSLVLLCVSYFCIKVPIRCHYWLAQRGKLVEGLKTNYSLHLQDQVGEHVQGVIVAVEECGTNITVAVANLESNDLVLLPTRTIRFLKETSSAELLTSDNEICRQIGKAYATNCCTCC